jgi:WD40 repeat protein
LDSVLKGRIIQIKQFIEHVSRVLALRIREESNTLFSISADKKIIQWDLTTMNVIPSKLF